MKSKGFFGLNLAPPKTAKKRIPLHAQCSLCKLELYCKTPKMSLDGKGKRKILVTGESPGRQEDYQGRPFVGPSGQLLRNTLSKFGIDLRQDCWINNSARCHPQKDKLPEKAVEYCRPNVIKDIELLKPEIIILLGKKAVESVIGWLWKEDIGAANRWMGQCIPNQRLNAYICPTYHPARLLHTQDKKQEDDFEPREDPELLKLFFEKHLEAASKLSGRPWKEIPDYKSRLELIYDHEHAAKRIKELEIQGKPIAFDFETSSIKPDHIDSFIYSCAISDGNKSIAYPWHGKAIQVTKEILESNVPKIGYHLKFETRHCLANGIQIKNWLYDGMIGAHTLDNRRATKGLKFNAFCLLGVDSYDDDVAPFLKSDKPGANSQNRISEAPLAKVLEYNALDALYEWEVAQIGMKRIGIKL